MTGGLVQEFQHAVLPSISPSVTLVCTLLSILVSHWDFFLKITDWKFVVFFKLFYLILLHSFIFDCVSPCSRLWCAYGCAPAALAVSYAACWFAPWVPSCLAGTCTRKPSSLPSCLSGQQQFMWRRETGSTHRPKLNVTKSLSVSNFVSVLSCSILAVKSREDAGLYLVLTTTGHYSLFPLVFTPAGKPRRARSTRLNPVTLWASC